jgi:opacity protein-like surface antigen
MRKLLILLLVIGFAAVSYAGDASRRGTNGADQLFIPVGARSIATSGAFLANVSGVEAIYYNPAGLGSMVGTQAMFDYTSYIADISISYLAVGTNLGDLGSIGLTYKSINFGDIPVTTVDNPDGTGQTYSPSYVTAGLTYAKALTDRVIAGASFKVIYEGILNTAATGWAIDFGVQYHFNKNLSLGVSVANIGNNMRYTGEDLKIKTPVLDSRLGGGNAVYEADTEPFQIPSYFELSAAYKFFFNEQTTLGLGATFRNNNNLDDQIRVGAEFAFMNMFYLRGGYNYYTHNSDDYLFNSFSAGAGVRWEMIDGVTIMFDYAYRAVSENAFNANNIFTITLGVK